MSMHPVITKEDEDMKTKKEKKCLDLLWKAIVSSPIRKSMDDHPTCITSIIDQTPPEKHTPCTEIHPHGGGVHIPGAREIINVTNGSFCLQP